MADEQEIWGALKHDRELAEMYLLRYPTMLADYERNKRVLSGLSIRPADENVGGGRSNIPGHPAEAAAIRSVDYDCNDMYRWLKAVEIVERGLGVGVGVDFDLLVAGVVGRELAGVGGLAGDRFEVRFGFRHWMGAPD